MTVEELRSRFPALDTNVYGKSLVYLDNAATSQRPFSVIQLVDTLAFTENANIHRAVHRLSSLATARYEDARAFVCGYINSDGCGDVVFTSGATSAINLVAFSFGEAFVSPGDEVILSVDNHHSNIVPWQMMCSRKGAQIKVLDIKENGVLEVEGLEKLISKRTKIIAIPHISNVLGIINPVKEICKIAHSSGVPVLIDGAQGIVHSRVDVSDLDCDFYVFSGHKVYAPTGTGVLFGKSEWLEKMPPYMGGGEMIESVSFSGTTYARSPQKFEAGTQNFNSAPALVPALSLTAEMLKDKELIVKQKAVFDYIFDALEANPRVTLFGSSRENKVPLFSFSVDGAHHEDLALILDKNGIALRSGQMCAEPLMDRLGVTGLLRASFAPYNTLSEAEYFISCLEKAINMLV